MAIYHCSVKMVKRTDGRTATAAAAYRAGEKILDEQTGITHDYSRKKGVLSTELVLPENSPEWAKDRSKLWNEAEKKETRTNSQVAREYEIALPRELTQDQRREIAVDYAKSISQKYGVAVDVALHAPNTVTDKDLEKKPDLYWEIDPVDGRRHNGNWHAHLLCSTRKLEAEGFSGKTRELDDRVAGPLNILDDRKRFADMQNEKLEEHGHKERVDHRSHADRGIEEAPQHRIPTAAFQYERRTGEKSRFTMDRDEVMDKLSAAKSLGEQERSTQQLSFSQQLMSTETNIQSLLFDRAKLQLEAGAELIKKRQADKIEAERTEQAKERVMSLAQLLQEREPFQLRELPAQKESIKDWKLKTSQTLETDDAAKLQKTQNQGSERGNALQEKAGQKAKEGVIEIEIEDSAGGWGGGWGRGGKGHGMSR